MNRTIRSVVCAAAVTGLVFGLGACSEVEKAVKAGASEGAEKAADELLDKPYEVTYEVTGKDVETIDYTAGSGTDPAAATAKDKKPVLPWKKTVTLNGATPPSVMPNMVDVLKADPDVTCKVSYQGKVLKEAKGVAAASGGCIAMAPLER
ncbi:MmpS family transport accessory protein [Streptomyces sp. NPDC091272]|uniref:MmpS family transport accessory protein n=1 Tax=Streptomyces sp. NPDC091272 TaxID=3365981 RepID=UPI003807F249